MVAMPQSAFPGDAPVDVQWNGNRLQLKVKQTTSLSATLRATCIRAKVACDGTELLSGNLIAPMTTDGKFLEVVSRLIEGVDVNTIYTQGTSESLPKLMFVRRESAVAPEPSTVGTRTIDPAQGLAEPPPPSGSSIRDTSSPTPATSTFATLGTSARQVPGNATYSAEVIAAVEEMFVANPNDAVEAEFLPFPDEHGNPVLVKPVRPTLSPFPDEFGRPAQIPSGKPSSPFPPAEPMQAPN
jgi:hypothetical protein